ncbi:MAG: protease complex subunit PrcB family protein, partial [Heliobacteriaceae bacterium]|nr:protease complex subunit PrcB family protein [Heliobacteriaceae bacterium]
REGVATIKETAEENTYPVAIQSWIEDCRQRPGAGYKVAGDQAYLLASWGEKPTAGYAVAITGMATEPERVVVAVEFREPAGMTAQVITYPYAVRVVDSTAFAGKEVVFVDTASGESLAAWKKASESGLTPVD